ncbi:MAG TPA: DsrE/DsrF/DrsH-like family protein [Vicinamibacteria bacterium]|jgi:peroxiredoxin family protein
MDVNAPTAPAEIQGTVAAEVERQLKAFRDEIEGKLAQVRERTVDDAATIIVFSGDLDKVLAGFVLATGAAAAGLETSMFFTFWGLSALKKKGAAAGSKNIMEKMFALMTPSSSESLGTSKMNYFGMGSVMLRKMMKDKQIASLEELMAIARELNVKLIACTMSMDAMGVAKEELIDELTYGGVATYMADAVRSRVTLFI